MTTREERAELRALAEAATPGPWSLPSGPSWCCPDDICREAFREEVEQ